MPFSFGSDMAESPGKVGGFGADPSGGRGAEKRFDSGSELYEESPPAPVSIPPPLLLSLGMPAANRNPIWGAELMPAGSPPPPVSLLLLTRFAASARGGGDRLLGNVKPGTGGAPPTSEPGSGFLSIIGADRSFVTAFLRRVPFEISDSKAPYCTT